MGYLIDVLLLGIIGFSIFKYGKDGFVKSVLRLTRLLLSFVITAAAGKYVAELCQVGDGIGNILCHVVLFFAVYVALIFITAVVGKLIKSTSIVSKVDKVLGCTLGLVAGILYAFLVSVVLGWLLNFIGWQGVIDNSILLGIFAQVI